MTEQRECDGDIRAGWRTQISEEQIDWGGSFILLENLLK